MPQPEPHTHTYLTQLTAVLSGLAAVLLSLVAFIVNWFKKTQEGQQDQLDAGIDEFTSLKLRVQHLEDDNKAIREWCIVLEKDLDLALKELAAHHDFIAAVKIHHFKQHGDQI